MEILFLSSREIGHRKIDGRTTRFRRDLYIRPGRDHGRGINERSNCPAMHDGSDGNKRVGEWKGQCRHPRLYLGELHTQMSNIGRGREKLTNEIRTRERMFHWGTHAISPDMTRERTIDINPDRIGFILPQNYRQLKEHARMPNTARPRYPISVK